MDRHRGTEVAQAQGVDGCRATGKRRRGGAARWGHQMRGRLEADQSTLCVDPDAGRTRWSYGDRRCARGAWQVDMVVTAYSVVGVPRTTGLPTGATATRSEGSGCSVFSRTSSPLRSNAPAEPHRQVPFDHPASDIVGQGPRAEVEVDRPTLLHLAHHAGRLSHGRRTRSALRVARRVIHFAHLSGIGPERDDPGSGLGRREQLVRAAGHREKVKRAEPAAFVADRHLPEESPGRRRSDRADRPGPVPPRPRSPTPAVPGAPTRPTVARCDCRAKLD